MILWITNNLATILISVLLLLIVALVVFYLYKQRSKGACASCPHASTCTSTAQSTSRDKLTPCPEDRADTHTK